MDTTNVQNRHITQTVCCACPGRPAMLSSSSTRVQSERIMTFGVCLSNCFRCRPCTPRMNGLLYVLHAKARWQLSRPTTSCWASGACTASSPRAYRLPKCECIDSRDVRFDPLSPSFWVSTASASGRSNTEANLTVCAKLAPCKKGYLD